jgi:hypothetical protein
MTKNAYECWAVIGEDGKIAIAKSLVDLEEIVQVHRTKQLAKGAAFAGEKIVRAKLTWESR